MLLSGKLRRVVSQQKKQFSKKGKLLRGKKVASPEGGASERGSLGEDWGGGGAENN